MYCFDGFHDYEAELIELAGEVDDEVDCLERVFGAAADEAVDAGLAYPDEQDHTECTYCPNGVGAFMGMLGNDAWYRCRQCGTEFQGR